jgi:Na+:H+ antiporter, NhaC family
MSISVSGGAAHTTDEVLPPPADHPESVVSTIPAPATRDGQPASALFALLSLLALVAVLATGLLYFDAPLPLVMIVGFCVATGIAAVKGVSYHRAEQYAFNSIRQGLEPVLIFVAVGALIACWILSGTVPTMIYLGLELITPAYFLPTAIVLCAITSFINGTNFGTVATVGLALIGVAQVLDIPLGIAAGAILSGAIFGDKMSPVSDTTVMAAGLGGVRLGAHIRHMMWTTVPAIVITLIIFTIIGFGYEGDAAAAASIERTLAGISDNFNIGLLPLIPPVIVLGLLIARREAFPSLAAGAAAGVLVAVFYQNQETTGGALKLLGLASILVFALATVGVLTAAGVLQAMLVALESRLTTARRLLPATLVITALLNAVGGAVNFAVALSSTTLRPLYDKLGVQRKNLSRAVEDAGNTTGPLIPWNATAVFSAGALGVSTATYLPWAVFCYLTPVISLIFALVGFTITRGPGSRRDDDEVTV